MLTTIFPILPNLLDVAGDFVTLAFVEYIHASIAPRLVKLFSEEMPPEVREVHSMKPAISWVVPVISRVVSAVADTSPPAAYSYAAAMSSLGVKL